MGNLRIYRASAGAGKTYTLVKLFLINALRTTPADDEGAAHTRFNPYTFGETLCVTFTQKATAEMKARIISQLYDLAHGRAPHLLSDLASELGLAEEVVSLRARLTLRTLLHHYSLLSVSTIDSFVQRLVSTLIWELDLGNDIAVSLETEVYLLLASQALLRSMTPDSPLYAWCKARAKKKLDNGERWGLEQALAAKGHILLSDRFALLSQAKRDLQFSLSHFTEVQNALVACRQRLDDEINWRYKTLSDLVKQQPSYRTELKRGGSALNALEKVVEELPRKGIPLDFPSASVKELRDAPLNWLTKEKQKDAALVGYVAQAYPAYCELLDYLLAHTPDYNGLHLTLKQLPELALLNELRTHLFQVEQEDNTRLLGDLAALLVEVAGGNDTAFIYERMGVRYNSLFVDEFQDTSRLHWCLLEPFVQNAISQGGEALLVGDVKQAIYRWRGGDWQLLAKEIPDKYENNLSLETLADNYRSARQVVEFNNQLFERLLTATQTYTRSIAEGVPSEDSLATLRKTIDAHIASFQTLLTSAYADAKQGVKSQLTGGVHLTLLPKPDKKSSELAPTVKYTLTLIDTLVEGGIAPDKIAVLVRTRRMAQEFVAAISQHQREGGTPYAVVSQDGLLLDASLDVQLALAALRIAAGVEEDLDLATVAQFVNEHLAPDEAWTSQIFDHEAHETKLSPHLKETLAWLRNLATLPLLDLFDSVLQGLGLPSHSGEMPYIATLRDKVYTFQQRQENNVHAFLEFYASQDPQKRHVSSGDTAGALNLLTIHKAKGLEFDTVICPELNYQLLLSNDDTVLWDEAPSPLLTQLDTPTHLGILPHGVSLQHLASTFAPNTVDEYLLRTVDALNTYYVAFTRAKRQLYLVHDYEPKTEKKSPKKSSVGTFTHDFSEVLLPVLKGLPWTDVSAGEDGANETGASHCDSTENGVQQYHFGEKESFVRMRREASTTTQPETDDAVRRQREASTTPDNAVLPPDASEIKKAFPDVVYLQSAPLAGRMVLNGQDLDLATQLARSEAASLGTKLHKLMTTVDTAADLPALGAHLVREQLCDAAVADRICASLGEAMQDEVLRACYERAHPAWAEHDLLAADGAVLRPDRVVFLPDHTVVIDFKFGSKRPGHRLQVARYAEVLAALGYPHPEGVLWYIHVDGSPCEVLREGH